MLEPLKGKIAVGLLKILALLPLSCLRGLGLMAGKILWFSHSSLRFVTEANIRYCLPELSDSEATNLAQKSLTASAQAILESAAILLWSEKRNQALILSVENEELIKVAAASGRGVIVVMPHLGNWELFSWYFPKISKTTCLYRAPKLAALDTLMKTCRSAGGIEVVPTNNRGIGKIVKSLKAGHMTGILPDQVPRPESGVFAPFFGHPALTMTLVSNLARKTNAVVISGFAKRVPEGFKIVFNPVSDRIYDADELSSITAVNEIIESCIVQAPEQYQWEYKRFKRQPMDYRGDKMYKSVPRHNSAT